MSQVSPWVSVSPGDDPGALLGPLPMKPGTVAYPIPPSVVPDDATGILVFAWCALTGDNPGSGFWHTSVLLADGSQNWFSLIGVGASHAERATLFNSQAFWLPMPVDRKVRVTLGGSAFPGANKGMVEIHGYMPSGS